MGYQRLPSVDEMQPPTVISKWCTLQKFMDNVNRLMISDRSAVFCEPVSEHDETAPMNPSMEHLP